MRTQIHNRVINPSTQPTSRRAVRLFFTLLICLGVSPALFAQTSPASFTYTGAVQTFTVPAGVTTLTVVANGAQGGGAIPTPNPLRVGGKGGRVTATLSVTPSQSLSLYVGGVPFNGGGAGDGDGGNSGGGGGATDIRIGGTALNNRILVAGGGGGGSFGFGGGSGGGLTGGSGAASGSGRGSGGSQSAGGSGGGTAGTAGVGGDSYSGGGGGGGGYFGGGGGGSLAGGAAGGGGSSYPASATGSVTSVVHEQGINTGDGSITLSWVAAPVLPPAALYVASPAIDQSILTLSAGCPLQFTGQGWGKTFVMTGPGGYVYTNAFRDFVLGSSITSAGIKQPGTYTMTAYGVPGQTPVSYQIVVTGTGCN